MQITLKDALGFLDPADNSSWTSDGLPRMDVVERLVDDKSITRQDVTDADPELTREVAAARRVAEINGAEAEVELDEEKELEPLLEEVTKFDLDQDIQTIQDEISFLEAKRDALARERDKLQVIEYGASTPKADTEARLAFIRSQHEIRMERAMRRADIFKHIRKGDLDPRCKLDQAMTRKTERGTARPIRPSKEE